jgi:hypothetical protein
MRSRKLFGGPSDNQVRQFDNVVRLVLGIVIPSVLGGLFLRYRIAALEADLIRDLADKGMDADDIVRVISASMPPHVRQSRKKALAAMAGSERGEE